MDHMGFLKHLRKYKAEIGSLKATIGNLKRDIDILTGNRDYWRERYEQREREYWAHILNLEKMLQPLPDDILEQMKNARAMIIAEDPKLEFMEMKEQEGIDALAYAMQVPKEYLEGKANSAQLVEADKLILRDLGYKDTRLSVKAEIRQIVKE